MQPPVHKLRVSVYRLLYIALAIAVMYLLVTHVGDFKSSLSQLKNSNKSFDLLALAAVIVAFFFTALTFYVIALKPLRYLRTVVLETAINTLNHLLPAGLGAIAGNYIYLTKSRHTKAQATAVVAVNNTIGVVANLLIVGVLILYSPPQHFKYKLGSTKLLIIALTVVLAVVIGLIVLPALRRKLRHALKITSRNLARYRYLKGKLLLGLLCQMGLALADAVCLYFALRAVNGHIPVGEVVLAYSFGVWFGTVIPAPGGVGSTEAGLAAGLIAFGVNLPTAVAAVLTFRLISFWLPFIVGILPLIWSYKKGYL